MEEAIAFPRPNGIPHAPKIVEKKLSKKTQYKCCHHRSLTSPFGLQTALLLL
jgi:hypothetical protein